MKCVAHGGKRLAVLIVARLAEKPSGKCRALFKQLVENAAYVFGGGRLAVFKPGPQPGLADQLFDECAANAV